MTIDFISKRGDTFKGAIFTISLSGGGPLDLTDASIISQIKKDCSDIASVFEFTDITITDPSNGEFQLEPVIIDLSPRDYVYDIQIITSDGIVRTPIEGTFTITNDVSR